MADLVTTISETVTLNGSLRGSSNSVTTTDIVDVVERILTCTHSQTTTIAVFAAFPYSSAGAFDVDRCRYIRVTNLDLENNKVPENSKEEIEIGKPFKSLSGHNHFVSGLSLSKDSKYLVSSSWWEKHA